MPDSLLDVTVLGNYEDIVCILYRLLSVRVEKKEKNTDYHIVLTTHILWKDKTKYPICLKHDRAEWVHSGDFN